MTALHWRDDFRDAGLVRGLQRAIATLAPPHRRVRLMEFCGGHTHAISRHGLEDLLPDTVELVHGPGCPVCVLPAGRIDQAVALAQQPDVTLCTYGDLIRVPGSRRQSLRQAQADGARIQTVTSPLAALALAQAEPQRQVVFLAIGFETTAPATAALLLQARAQGVRNLSVLCLHVQTPPAMQAVLGGPEPTPLDGLIGPAHVSTVIGCQPYEAVAQAHRLPIVVAGFEPLDLLQAIWMLLAQIGQGTHRVENAFARAVRPQGNPRARQLMDEVFETRSVFDWRGLGALPDSALQLRPAFADADAERRFALPYRPVADHPACDCAAVVRGVRHPRDCRLFDRGCHPDHPIGSCMVSPEGACAAYYHYGRFRATGTT